MNRITLTQLRAAPRTEYEPYTRVGTLDGDAAKRCIAVFSHHACGERRIDRTRCRQGSLQFTAFERLGPMLHDFVVCRQRREAQVVIDEAQHHCGKCRCMAIVQILQHDDPELAAGHDPHRAAEADLPTAMRADLEASIDVLGPAQAIAAQAVTSLVLRKWAVIRLDARLRELECVHLAHLPDAQNPTAVERALIQLHSQPPRHIVGGRVDRAGWRYRSFVPPRPYLHHSAARRSQRCIELQAMRRGCISIGKLERGAANASSRGRIAQPASRKVARFDVLVFARTRAAHAQWLEEARVDVLIPGRTGRGLDHGAEREKTQVRVHEVTEPAGGPHISRTRERAVTAPRPRHPEQVRVNTNAMRGQVAHRSRCSHPRVAQPIC
jgi:hypothetical protein